jgi:hypothetical protein
MKAAALEAALGKAAVGPTASAAELLRTAMVNDAVDLQTRLRCATALLSFELARPAVAPPPPPHGGSLARRLDDAFKRTGRPRSNDPAADVQTEEPRGLSAEDQAALEEMLS